LTSLSPLNSSHQNMTTLDMQNIDSVTRRQAAQLAGHGGAAPITMHASICIGPDGLPCTCAATGKTMCLYMGGNAQVLMPTDPDTVALSTRVKAVNQLPEAEFEDFFNAIAPFMANRIGGHAAALNNKQVIMRTFRARVLHLFNLVANTGTSEQQKGAYISFHFNNQVHGMICDNVLPGESSYHFCHSVKQTVKRMTTTTWVISFVRC
jgi:hypothetical protein